MPADTLITGRLYEVTDRLRGAFRATVLHDDGTFAYLEVAPGYEVKAGARGARCWSAGEQVSLMKCRAMFTLLPQERPVPQTVQ